MFMGLLTNVVDAFNHTKWVLLSYQKCTPQPSLTNLHPNENSQKCLYCPFAVKLDRFVGSCTTLNDLSNKVCIPNKTEDLNLRVLNMITGRNESNTITKHLSCECLCRFDGRKCNSDQWRNNDKC